MSKTKMNWHRLFGLFLCDYFEGTPFEVELEKDLSRRIQLLDVAILRRHPGNLVKSLPDGFEDLADHNLISFKSYRGRFDRWSIIELLGHYANYRKQAGPSMKKMPPESAFRLFAVCIKYPKGLLKSLRHAELSPGVYELLPDLKAIRLLCVERMPVSDANSLLQLFSGKAETVKAAQSRFKLQTDETSSLIEDLLGKYQEEGKLMPYTMDDFRKYYKKKTIAAASPEERLEGLSAGELLKGLTDARRMKHLSAEERKQLRETLDKLAKS